MNRILFTLLSLLLAFSVVAHAHQDPAPVVRAIEDFLRIQTKGLPGQATYSVGSIDPANNLVPCQVFDVQLAPGARLWGRTNVTVRCSQESGWTLFVPVQIKVVGPYVVTARPLSQGQTISAEDLTKQSGNLTDLPTGVLTDPAQAIGRVALSPIPSGRPLRGDLLRQVLVVQQGQSIKVLSKGEGFSVANDGRALNNAAEGQVVQVRLANGQVISGIARQGGIAEVGY